MKENKYYVSAKHDVLDLGMEIIAENPYMAAVCFVSKLYDDFSLDDVIVTDVELVGVEAQND